MPRWMKEKISPDWFECPDDCIDDDTFEREITETDQQTDDHDEREQVEPSQASNSVERSLNVAFYGRRLGVVLERLIEPIDPTGRDTSSRVQYEATYPCSYSALQDRQRERNRYRPNFNRYLNSSRGESGQPEESQRTRRHGRTRRRTRKYRPIRMSRREQHNRWRNRYGRNPRELS